MDIRGYSFTQAPGTAKNRAEAIETLASLLKQNGSVASAAALIKEVTQRDAELSCELAPRLFVPHAKSENVLRPAVAAIRTDEGESVYLIASNENDAHITALSEIAKEYNKSTDE